MATTPGKPITWALPAGGLLALLGCSGSSDGIVVRDTTGATYDLSCDEQSCDVERISEHTCGEFTNLVWERFFAFCPADKDGGDFDDCRLAACSSDDECPTSLGFVCSDRGLCENDSVPDTQNFWQEQLILSACLGTVETCFTELPEDEVLAQPGVQDAYDDFHACGDGCTDLPLACEP